MSHDAIVLVAAAFTFVLVAFIATITAWRAEAASLRWQLRDWEQTYDAMLGWIAMPESQQTDTPPPGRPHFIRRW